MRRPPAQPVARVAGAAGLALLLATAEARGAPAQSPAARHAVVRLEGDLDARATADALVEAIAVLDALAPRLILIELTGNRSRPDLLHDAVRAVMEAETPIAVWLADRADRRVGPGMLALALAADHAGIGDSTRIERTVDDALTELNPGIDDWAVVNLDLRSVARDLAERGPLDRLVYESALAPRSSLWVVRDGNGSSVLSPDETRGAEPLVARHREGWSFRAGTETAAGVYRLGVHRTPRAFASALGVRARPLRAIEIESDLGASHERCLALVGSVREAVRLAEAALDVRAGRADTARTLPHEYRAAAASASALVAPSREAIAEIASLTDRLPEILQMPPPPDDDAPTEIGGADTSRLGAWRGAVRDLEYDLSRLDDRIAAYRRR